MIFVTPQIQIPDAELEFSFVRSSGPGGQNVNKVNSKAVLRWNLRSSPSLSIDLRGKLMSRLQSRLTSEGELIITCDEYRDQGRNRDAACEKLKALLLAANQDPKPRKETKPSRSRENKNREARTRHSEKKKQRRYRLDE
jgi:ribosome-associated protein